MHVATILSRFNSPYSIFASIAAHDYEGARYSDGNLTGDFVAGGIAASCFGLRQKCERSKELDRPIETISEW